MNTSISLHQQALRAAHRDSHRPLSPRPPILTPFGLRCAVAHQEAERDGFTGTATAFADMARNEVRPINQKRVDPAFNPVQSP